MATDEEIMNHHDEEPDPGVWVTGPPVPRPIVIAEPDPLWPATFELIAARLRAALGPTALAVEHVGSTAVSGLPAKPVIDIDVTVADPADESSYREALEGAGFTLVVREPDWHGHRCFRLETPEANVHVFGPDCPETIRHRLFRDWLRVHPGDRDLYVEAKRSAAAATMAAGGVVMDYNRRKEDTIRAISDRIFATSGLQATDG
ncbi:MAG: GrpB family protein [Micrococcaceae bacterium]|uniref:GrpB family protein n=1 Tax=Arthrobacter TaxID=1663 RepID=UPI0026562D47|nr:GrpB family protein [Micrococcaceae bacterium]MDN6168967.1 GrpB family protein [Micrococcaceae bacterium]MDN6177775.1 GrpB family protein [Micrococcaceae bacterium]MDN6298839.1 GrpB family protein [Micrococcaceae bacterium]